MRVMTIVGARPQFIKEAMVSRQLTKEHEEILVHTGQHFDYNMSESFFEELQIPHPKYNLGISGGRHGQMTGRMLGRLEEVMVEEKPDMAILYGDTNSTLAGALAGAKLHIPLAHVEAGARTYCMTNPEEINRVCTDHVSNLLLASTQEACANLEKEGIGDRAVFVGNTMYDAFAAYSRQADAAPHKLLSLDGGGERRIPHRYYYLTCHREENAADDESLTEILRAMEALDAPVIYPVHPRNKARALQIAGRHGFSNTILAEPVGYLTSIYLVNHAEKVITDSGGLQTEAFFAEKKCVTILDFVTWPETMAGNRNSLAKPTREDILDKLGMEQRIDKDYRPFGDGHAAEKIVETLSKYMEGNGIVSQ